MFILFNEVYLNNCLFCLFYFNNILILYVFLIDFVIDDQMLLIFSLVGFKRLEEGCINHYQVEYAKIIAIAY